MGATEKREILGGAKSIRINNGIHVPVLPPISNVTITNNSTFLIFFTGQIENNYFELENSLQMSKFH